MCSIYGLHGVTITLDNQFFIADFMGRLALLSGERGRDAAGFMIFSDSDTPIVQKFLKANVSQAPHTLFAELMKKSLIGHRVTVLGNWRAEPTTEWVKHMTIADVQPYHDGKITYAVHNGTIANDEDFIPADAPTRVDSQAIPYAAAEGRLFSLVGSVATAIVENGDMGVTLTLAKNYRPLSVIRVNDWKGYAFASSIGHIWKAAFGSGVSGVPVPFPANSALQLIGKTPPYVMHSDCKFSRAKDTDYSSSLVIFSGGMDSTVAATQACLDNTRVTLAHFHYGCRAQERETKAVRDVYDHLSTQFPDTKIDLKFFDLDFLKTLGGNPLVDTEMEIASGKDGIEYANEWVPFRNGLMLSMAAAYCDRHQIGAIYLGTNLEEAGAYGDNEAEFFDYFGKALAIGAQSAPKINTPLSNLMKHEIVAMADKICAPIHLSWSCYHGHETPCGTCGPCVLRQTAFAMNGKEDSIHYTTPTVVGL